MGAADKVWNPTSGNGWNSGVNWSQSGAGGQTLAGALTLGKDTEFRTEGGSALPRGANPSGAGALIKSGAQGLVYARTDNPAHAGGTRVQSGLLQWGYTTAGGSDTTLRFGGGAGLLTLDSGLFELKASESDSPIQVVLDNPVRVTTNGGVKNRGPWGRASKPAHLPRAAIITIAGVFRVVL